MGLRALHRPGSGASPHGSFEGAWKNILSLHVNVSIYVHDWRSK